MAKRDIAILMACHNRKELTVRCINALEQAKPAGWDLHYYLVDDGSTDGTTSALRNLQVPITIKQGAGDWYWAKSMAQAEKMANPHHDGVLWINDDIELYPTGLLALEREMLASPHAILVGQLEHPETKKPTYGGFLKISHHPMRYDKVFAKDKLRPIDTFNGNFVYIPRAEHTKIGPIDGKFQHSYADCDYGLRAKRAGVQVFLMPEFVGTCPLNPPKEFKTKLDHFKFLWSPKGSPLRSQIRFFRRHAPWRWPLYIFGPYIKVLIGVRARKYSNVD